MPECKESAAELQKLAELALVAAAELFGEGLAHESFSLLVDWLETAEAYETPGKIYQRPRFPTMPFALGISHESGGAALTISLVVSQTPDSSAFVEAVLFNEQALRLANREVVHLALLDWAISEAEDIIYRYRTALPTETIH